MAFEPIPDPKTGSASEGPAQIAFAPPGFPAGVRNGIFVGFHGRSELGGISNEENPLVFWSLATGAWFDFVGNDEPNIGHMDGLVATRDSLFVADLSRSGGLSGYGAGAIYQIKRIYRPTGDIDDDGVVTIGDVVTLLKFAVGLQTPTPEQLALGDISPAAGAGGVPGDGALRIDDVIRALRKAVGLEPQG